MAPEVYMTLRHYDFTPKSVSHDREKVDRLLAGRNDANQIRATAWKRLEVLFNRPHILEAIEILTEKVGENDACINNLSSSDIHPIIDPILSGIAVQ